MKNLNLSRTLAALLFASALILTSISRAPADMHYVDVNSTNATSPYSNWATAATNIQDAVDVAMVGDEVVVTNGTYATGERATVGSTINRVAVDKPLSVRSVNGPQFTIIDGGRSGRCVYLTDSASLSGFTLTHGVASQVGGGVLCESMTAVVSNCVITGNWTSGEIEPHGGGAYGGTLESCTLTGNSVFSRQSLGFAIASGGGAAQCNLNNCTLSDNEVLAQNSRDNPVFAGGGGAFSCTLSNCTLVGNTAGATCLLNFGYLTRTAEGGGAAACTLYNCTLRSNSASASMTGSQGEGAIYARGGGASRCTLYNCKLSGNSAGAANLRSLYKEDAYAQGGAAYSCSLNNSTMAGNSATATNDYQGLAAFAQGGGACYGTLNNCIIYFNRTSVSPGSWIEDDYYFDYYFFNSSPNNCWVSDPLFVDQASGNLRLQSNSPCINAGNNAYAPVGPDLDGNPRIVGGTVDIGAYEFQSPVSMISYAWLQQYGLPINSSTDRADADGDGVDNYHEWLGATDPNNSLSSPAQLTVTPSATNVILTWSTNAVGFILQSTTNLGSSAGWTTNAPAPFVIRGQNTVTNPLSGPQQFYRLVQ